MIGKYYYLIIIIMFNLLILAGCWSYGEVNDRYLVAGVAIDFDIDTEEYILTVEIINPKETEIGINSRIFSAKGETLHRAIRNLIMESGKILYWGHAKVAIISKEIAKKNIIPVLDLIYRDIEFRDDIWLLISGEDSAGVILSTPEEKLHRINSLHLDDIMKTDEFISQFKGTQVWKFVKDLYVEGISPTIPITKLVTSGDYKLSEIIGTAIFKGDRLIGMLNEDETQAFRWATGDLKGGKIVVKTKLDNGEATNVTLEIGKGKSSINSVYEEDRIKIIIEIKQNILNIAQIDGTDDFIADEGREKLKEDIKEKIRREILALVKKVQKKYKSDIFGFSTAIKKEMPQTWKKIKPNWEEVFSDLDIEVKVDLDIIGSALSSKSIKVKH